MLMIGWVRRRKSKSLNHEIHEKHEMKTVSGEPRPGKMWLPPVKDDGEASTSRKTSSRGFPNAASVCSSVLMHEKFKEIERGITAVELWKSWHRTMEASREHKFRKQFFPACCLMAAVIVFVAVFIQG